ncbi:hypothetical protein HJ590_15905 [Naumannella sp. ID2617S]|nr:hypothetical protein [Naumannella sp. ID2617S]
MAFLRGEYLGRGNTSAELAAAVRSKQLVRLRRGVYAEPSPHATPEERHLELLRATLPALLPGSVFSYATAGVLHGLWLPQQELRRIHVSRTGRGGGSVSRHLHVHRSTPDTEPVQAPEGTEWTMTGLLETTVDLLRHLPVADAVAVADSALRKGLHPVELADAISGRKRVPGNRIARLAAGFADPLSESRGESWSRWRMHELGLPAPRLQHRVVNADGEHVARCDFWWPELNLVGEFDGAVKYGRLLKPGQSVQEVVLSEKQREEAIRRQGLWLTRWTWREVRSDRFGDIIRQAMKYGPQSRQVGA